MGKCFSVLTHHKCASTWLIRYVREFCALNTMTMGSTHLSEVSAAPDMDVFAWQNASYPFISNKMQAGLHLIRNPMDIVISAYHSHKKTHSVEGWPELAMQREVLARCSVAEGLFLTLAFLERDDFYNGAVGPLHALRHWDFDDPRYRTLRMEDIVTDPIRHLGSVLQAEFPRSALPPLQEHTFVAIAGRQVGMVDESSHYRSGRSDQWRDDLTQPIIEYMRAHYADVLRRFYPHVYDG